MTQEEKAKKYDEALERAKKQRADYQKELDKTDKNSQLAGLLRAGISAIDMAFPELAESESENERIRKWLVEYFSSIGEKSWLHSSSITLKEVLAWLEKQKEPKSISAEEALVRAGLKPYKDGNKWCILAGDNIQEGICGFGDTIDEALYQFLMEVFEKQKEQKWSPSEGEMGVLYKLCYISNQITDEDDTELTRLYQDLKREYFNGHSFENMFPSEKSSKPELETPDWVYGGWDDEYMINTVIGRYNLHAEVAKKHGDTHDYNLSKSMENWLRNVVKPLILEKQKEQKSVPISCNHENGTPAEWSEEDEASYNAFICEVVNEKMNPTIEQIRWLRGICDKLKSLSSIKQEWSEEDEKMFKESLTDIIYAKNELNKKGCEGLAKSALNAFNWLNTRFKYLCSQPKKNDIITPNKKFFQWIYDRLINVHNEDPNVDYMISFKNRIEELPIDKPHWKPSEEQMNRLVSVVAALRKDYCDDMADFLAEIYQGLKKLM